MTTSRQSADQYGPSVGDVRPEAGSSPGSSTKAVFSCDLDGKFAGCSPAFAKLLEYSPSEIANRNLFSLLLPQPANPKDKDQLRSAILASASAQQDYYSKLIALAKSGARVAVDLTATVLWD